MWNQTKDFDRYIPKRFDSEISSFNLAFDELIPQYLIDDVTNGKSNYPNPPFSNIGARLNAITNFRKRILETLDIRHHKVLRAFPSEIFTQNKTNANKAYKEPMWPVFSRKIPLLKDPVTVLDLPLITSLETHTYRQIADWSRHGIVSTFDGEIYIWNDDGNGAVQKSNTCGSLMECVKWSSSADRIAASFINYGETILAIFDSQTFKILEKRSCSCEECMITAITWCKSANIPVVGCDGGTLTAFAATPKHKIISPNNEIIDIQFSCNETFMLVVLKRGDLLIFKWPCLEKSYLVVRYRCLSGYRLKSFSWHPWSESLLAVADNYGEVQLVNVNSCKVKASRSVEPLSKKKFILDHISFNPLSAELAVSFYHDHPISDDKGFNIISVYSNLDTKVEEVKYHTDRVPSMMWDPTGKRLATLGTDESMALWDFFGGKEKTAQYERLIKLKKKNESSKNFDGSPNFGMCIR